MGSIKKKLFSNKFYYVNDAGEKFGPYDEVEILKSGKVKVATYGDAKTKSGKKQGVLHENGKIFIRLDEEFKSISERKGGFFVIKSSRPGRQDCCFIANPQGTVVQTFDPNYEPFDIVILNDDFAQLPDKIVPISKKYQQFYFENDCFIVRKFKKWGLIAKDGKEIFPVGFDAIQYDDKGVAVKIGDKWGYVLYDGSLVLECIYDEPPVFTYDVLIIKRDGKYGFADKSGKEIVSPKYRHVSYSFNGYAQVEAFESSDGTKYSCGLVDVKTGKEVVPCKYYGVGYLTGNYACVQEASKGELNDEDWVYDMNVGQTIGERSDYIYEKNGYIICADLGETGYYSVMSGENGEYVAHVDKDGLKRFVKPKDKEV